MTNPQRIRTSWSHLPLRIRAAAVLLLAQGLLNCILNFTPHMRASSLSPSAEVRGLMRLGFGVLWSVIVATLQPWGWVLVLAVCLVPLPVTVYLLMRQASGDVPSFLGHVQYVGPMYLLTSAINLAAGVLLVLPQSRRAFVQASEARGESPPI